VGLAHVFTATWDSMASLIVDNDLLGLGCIDKSSPSFDGGTAATWKPRRAWLGREECSGRQSSL